MIKFSKISWAVLFTSMGLASSSNGTLIDFESFSQFEQIQGVDLGGVTLSAHPNNFVLVYDNVFGLGSHSGTKCFADPSGAQVNRIIGVFSVPQTHVRLWGGNSLSSGVLGWHLEVFDSPSGGNSLGISSSGQWPGTPYAPLQVDVPGIMRFEAYLDPGSNGIGFDDLEFTPEPASMVLAAGGALGIRRRRMIGGRA